MSKHQVKTTIVSTAKIMGSPDFARGFDDVRKGIAFDLRIGGEGGDSWSYERGRLLAHIAPLTMPLRVGGKLNRKAVALFEAACDRKLIV